MPILQNIRSCVRRKHGVSRKPTKVRFNVRISDAFKSENIASQLRDLLVYIAREGVAVTDLFRRPGNPQSIKKIIADLEAGRRINWTEYTFYTLANIVKRFLLHIDGGLIGEKSESALIDALDIDDVEKRYAAMKTVIMSQPKTVQQLFALLFGTWFRMIYHTEVNAMSVEAVAKSVAGSVFPSCTYSPERVQRASKVMEILIVGFAAAELFGRELIEYFTLETKTSILRIEKFRYEFRFPKDVPRPKSTRMFMQMLLDESKKHGFDIVHDEVSREVFEAASQPVLTTFPNTSCNCGGVHNGAHCSPSEHNASSIKQQPSLRTPLATLQPRSENTYTSDPLRASISANFQREESVSPGDSLSTRVDRVQQYSEKRTRITAALDARFHSDSQKLSSTAATATASSGVIEDRNPFQQKRLVAADFQNSFTSNSLSDVDTVGDFERDTRQFLPGPKSGACFNSVKRRQLERLQKRSDWFLSPPAGLRNSGMIRLDSTSSPASKISRPPKNGVENSNTGPSVRDVGDHADMTINAESYLTPIGLRSRGNHRHTVENGHNCRQFAIPQSLSWSSTDPNGSRLYDEEEDEDELLETRYFIAEKYYGPDPRPPCRNNNNHLISSRSESPQI